MAATLADNTGVGYLSVLKSGTGLWILSGNNTYTGGTTVTAGNLWVNASSGTGNGNVFNTGGSTSVNANSGVAGNFTMTGGAAIINSGFGVQGNFSMTAGTAVVNVTSGLNTTVAMSGGTIQLCSRAWAITPWAAECWDVATGTLVTLGADQYLANNLTLVLPPPRPVS